MRRLGRVGLPVLLAAAFTFVAFADDPKTEKTPATKDDSAQVKPHRRTRVRIGGISVGAGYSHFSGYPYYGYHGYAPYLWDPFFYSPVYYSYFAPWPIYYPGYFNGYAWGPGMGQVKLQSEIKDADVLLNGGYAGVAKDLKNIWLEPGAYDLEVQAPGRAPYERRIYVLSGKTVAVSARMEPMRDRADQGDRKP